MTHAPIVLVPVNRLDRAKGRLAGVLSAAQRRDLAIATLRTVLGATAGAGFETVVLTSDPAVPLLATECGARVLQESPEVHGLNAQLEDALLRVGPARGGVLILHADLPLATTAALEDVTGQALPAPSVVLVRSSDGGTNAMLIRAPGRFALQYGVGSFERHVAAARAAGVDVVEAVSPALSLDLDTPEDLDAFLAHPAAAGTLAAAVLEDAGR